MPDVFDPYEVLGIPRDASPEDIKRAYRKAARAHHPDVNRDDDEAEDRFKDASRAYEMLTNPQPEPMPGRHAVPQDIHDILQNMFGFSRGPSRNIEVPVPMTLRHLIDGLKVTIQTSRRTKCPDCRGVNEATSHCPRCNGGGVVATSQTVELVIPPGLNVAPMILKGMGHEGMPGEPSGDLIVMADVKRQNGCQIVGRGVLMVDVGVDPTLFIIGGRTSVETPLGDTVSIDIPEGSSFGMVMSTPGMGLPMTFGRDTPRSQLVMRLVPQIPEDLSPERLDLLREYVRLGHDVGQSPKTSE